MKIKILFKYLTFLILSIIITISIAIIDAILRNQLVGGVAGLPLRFSEVAFFGGGETNYFYLGLDILFWFIVLLLVWKYLPKIFHKV